MEENCWVGQTPQGIVLPTEDNITVEQRKYYKQANQFYILFHEIYITKIIELKNCSLIKQHFYMLHSS